MIAPILITKKLPIVTREYPPAVEALLVTVLSFYGYSWSQIHAFILTVKITESLVRLFGQAFVKRSQLYLVLNNFWSVLFQINNF